MVQLSIYTAEYVFLTNSEMCEFSDYVRQTKKAEPTPEAFNSSIFTKNYFSFMSVVAKKHPRSVAKNNYNLLLAVLNFKSGTLPFKFHSLFMLFQKYLSRSNRKTVRGVKL